MDSTLYGVTDVKLPFHCVFKTSVFGPGPDFEDEMDEENPDSIYKVCHLTQFSYVSLFVKDLPRGQINDPSLGKH